MKNKFHFESPLFVATKDATPTSELSNLELAQSVPHSEYRTLSNSLNCSLSPQPPNSRGLREVIVIKSLRLIALAIVAVCGFNSARGDSTLRGKWATECYSSVSNEFPHFQRWDQYTYEFLENGQFRATYSKNLDPACLNHEFHEFREGVYRVGGDFGDAQELDLCEGSYCNYTVYQFKRGGLYFGNPSSSPRHRSGELNTLRYNPSL